MIDQNRDGFIDTEDLKDMLASLGRAEGFRVTVVISHCLGEGGGGSHVTLMTTLL